MGNKKALPPRRLRMKSSAQLQSAKNWLDTYTGKCIIRGYSKWYGVDHVCAATELETLGVKLDPCRVEQLRKSARERTRRRTLENKRRKEEQEREVAYDFDENFSYIAGNTPAGFPYGLTWGEWDRFADEGSEMSTQPATMSIPPDH